MMTENLEGHRNTKLTTLLNITEKDFQNSLFFDLDVMTNQENMMEDAFKLIEMENFKGKLQANWNGLGQFAHGLARRVDRCSNRKKYISLGKTKYFAISRCHEKISGFGKPEFRAGRIIA